MLSFYMYKHESEDYNPIIECKDSRRLKRYEIRFSYSPSVEIVLTIYKGFKVNTNYFSMCRLCRNEENIRKYIPSACMYKALKKENFFKDNNIDSIQLRGNLEKIEQSNSSNKEIFTKIYLRAYEITISKR